MKIPTPVSVEFDVAAFRAWLDSDSGHGITNKQRNPFLSATYDHLEGDAGWLAATVLASISGADAGWSVHGVLVEAHALAEAEGGTDGVFVEVRVGNQSLAVGRLSARDLIPIDDSRRLLGYEAAILALQTIATAANARLR